MTERKRDDGKVPSKRPSFSSFEDDPLATAGTGGSEDPKGLVRRGGGEVPADSDGQETTDPEEAPDDAATDSESGYSPHPDRQSAKKADSAV